MRWYEAACLAMLLAALVFGFLSIVWLPRDRDGRGVVRWDRFDCAIVAALVVVEALWLALLLVTAEATVAWAVAP